MRRFRAPFEKIDKRVRGFKTLRANRGKGNNRGCDFLNHPPIIILLPRMHAATAGVK